MKRWYVVARYDGDGPCLQRLSEAKAIDRPPSWGKHKRGVQEQLYVTNFIGILAEFGRGSLPTSRINMHVVSEPIFRCDPSILPVQFLPIVNSSFEAQDEPSLTVQVALQLGWLRITPLGQQRRGQIEAITVYCIVNRIGRCGGKTEVDSATQYCCVEGPVVGVAKDLLRSIDVVVHSMIPAVLGNQLLRTVECLPTNNKQTCLIRMIDPRDNFGVFICCVVKVAASRAIDIVGQVAPGVIVYSFVRIDFDWLRPASFLATP